jgi:GNAT superfamily N-acetyltransferase
VHRRHHHHAALAARPRRGDLLGEARQLAVKEVGQGGVKVDDGGRPLAESAGRPHRPHRHIAEHQRRPAERRAHRRGGLLQRLRRHRQAAGGAARLEVGRQALFVVVHLGGEGRRVDGEDQGPLQHRQERGAGGEERQVVLPAREGAGAAQALDQLGRLGAHVGLLLQQQLGKARGLDGAAGEEVEGEDADRVQRVLGALRLGVEPADRLDGIAEEVEPDRRLLAGREEVEDAAAHREVAHLVNEVGAPIAVAGEMRGEALEGVILAGAKGEDGGFEGGGQGQAAEEGARRGHHRRAEAPEEAVDRHRLLGAHLERHLGLLVGGERRRGEVDRLLLAAEQAGRLHPGQSVRLARHHHHQGAAEIACQKAPDPCRRRHRQAHDLHSAAGRGALGRRQEVAIGRATAQRPGWLVPHAVAHARAVYLGREALPRLCYAAGLPVLRHLRHDLEVSGMPDRFPQEAVLRDGSRLLIRPFTAADTDALYSFFLRLPEEVRRFAWDRIDNRALVEQWGRELDYDRVLPLIATDGQRIVADATLHRRHGSPLRLVGRIKWLFDPKYRGLGLGTILVNDFIRIARNDGLRHLACMLIADLEADAVRTLTGLGFDSYLVPGYGTDPDGNQHDMVKMVLKL